MRIETLAKFNASDDSLGLKNSEWSKYSFDINDVKIYNEADEGYTTIYTDLDRVTIAIEYHEFINLIPNDRIIISKKAHYEYKEKQ